MRRTILSLFAVLTLAACSASTPASDPPGASLATPSASPASSAPRGGDPKILPIFVSSEILADQNRFLFSLADRANKVVAAPDVPVGLEFYDVAADSDMVVFTADTRFLWAIEAERGLYVATVEFPKAGRWGVRFTAAFPDGRREQVRADLDVAESGSSPAIGAAAVSVDTPTASDVGGDLVKVSTDTAPNPAFYARSLANAVAAMPSPRRTRSSSCSPRPPSASRRCAARREATRASRWFSGRFHLALSRSAEPPGQRSRICAPRRMG